MSQGLLNDQQNQLLSQAQQLMQTGQYPDQPLLNNQTQIPIPLNAAQVQNLQNAQAAQAAHAAQSAQAAQNLQNAVQNASQSYSSRVMDWFNRHKWILGILLLVIIAALIWYFCRKAKKSGSKSGSDPLTNVVNKLNITKTKSGPGPLYD